MCVWAHQGNTTTVQELIKLGANINHAESDGWTALHFASLNGHEDTVNALLTASKIVAAEAVTEDGRTPRQMAEEAGYTSIVSMLDEYVAEQRRTDL